VGGAGKVDGPDGGRGASAKRDEVIVRRAAAESLCPKLAEGRMEGPGIAAFNISRSWCLSAS
jgi:hypothetical protein